MSNRIRVIVADSNRIHTQLLADALSRNTDLEVSEANGSAALLGTMDRNAQVAVVSSALDSEVSGGFSAVRKLSSSAPSLRCILLLDSIKREAIVEAFATGARGIFHRAESLEVLANCIRRVHSGQIWANSDQISYAVEALAAAPHVRTIDAKGAELLSKREREVVSCLAAGLSNREIGERLGLSQNTIKNYLLRIFDKLGVSSRLELLSLTLTQNASFGSPVQLFVADLLEADSSDHLLDTVACQEAAERGLTRAQLKMAELCLHGHGVEKDLISAYMWFVLAEKSSSALRERISTDKRKLAEVLSTEQILEAQRQASEKNAMQEKSSSAGSLQAHRDRTR